MGPNALISMRLQRCFQTMSSSLSSVPRWSQTNSSVQLVSNPVSPHRNRTRGPARLRAIQHPRLHRLPVAGSVQRDRPHQVRPENSLAGPDNADSNATGRGTCSSLAGVLPGQTSGIQLWSLTPHHPANVSCYRSVASGQHR